MLTPDQERPSLRFDLLLRRRPHELLEQSFLKTTVVYFAVLGVTIGGGVVAFKVFGLHPIPSILTLLGVVYLLAGSGWPRSLYLTLRSMGQFARVSDPLALRRGMLAIGALLFLAGLCLIYIWLNPELWPGRG